MGQSTSKRGGSRTSKSKKELDDGNLSFYLTRETGTKCVTVGAKDLTILYGDDSKYWEWTSHGNSRFSEVAKLKFAERLSISGNIKTDMLSGKTHDEAYITIMNPLKKKTVHEKPFTRLSKDSISEILSRTSPLDAARFSVLSKEFKSAADSDNTWEKFVPMELVPRSVSPLVYGSKKELCITVCSSPILLDDGNLSFALNREAGKKCFMVGAKDLTISWGDNSNYWEWTSDANSRFSEVARLKFVRWLDIRGKIKTDILSQNTRYKAYLIFKLGDGYSGFNDVKAVVKRVNIEADKNAEARATSLTLPEAAVMPRRLVTSVTRRGPVRKDDGWMEIKLGAFYNFSGDDGEVEARVMEIWRLNGKTGLIVEGIEFRSSAPKSV